jgi:hypothetical protein
MLLDPVYQHVSKLVGAPADQLKVCAALFSGTVGSADTVADLVSLDIVPIGLALHSNPGRPT